ncbi:MAG TPA: non-homologous end-joining DNA ligase [Gemmatimonadales bacterium]|jgi:DNA ligase D-like protein (predicted ligase)|nr:non-homologous end-joining DNA ligase [Gemmatimonadales bacterium]
MTKVLKLPQPVWMEPMLATLTDARPAGDGWIYEPKLDGVRCLVFAEDGRVRLMSRNRKPLDEAYPELVEALETGVRGNAILDGEVVAIDPATGLPSFALLQRRMGIRNAVAARRSGVAVMLYLFDCLFYEGVNLTSLPLLDRKSVLRDVVWFDDQVRFTPFKSTGSEAMYREACARGAEGIIAKRAASVYTGTRSGDWLKLKCVNQQEFVIGGFTDPKGDRDGFGALLVGYYDGGILRYAGKVGTGYDRRTLLTIHAALRQIERRTSPFGGASPTGADVHWVTPAVVAQIGFAEWTPGGLLRHPRFIGIRHDKSPAQVGRERAVTSRAASRSASPRSRP